MKLTDSKCLVVKIGSSLLIDSATKRVKTTWLKSLIDDLIHLKNSGTSIVIVSSGAVALGCEILSFHRKHLTIDKLQAAAAVGQIHLTHIYQQLLNDNNLIAAQVLLTLDDSENRSRYLNARNTMQTLLKLGVIPIVNENDTVATAEIRYGDNDRLAARVAQMISADTLILLSDIDGFYTADPNLNANATLIPEVHDLSPAILAMAKESNSNLGSGGMITKLAAAKIALASGCHLLITAGKHEHPIKHFIQHQKGTWFLANISNLNAKRAWIKEHLNPQGSIIIDDGAVTALNNGKSLLPIGIVSLYGRFKKGDVVSINSKEGQEVARGLCNYAADEIAKIKGITSGEILQVLGYEGIHEAVHYDNFVLLRRMEKKS